MLDRLDLRRAVALFRAPTAHPTDVLNVIRYRDFEWYRWYATFVLPMVYAQGGRAHWGGHRRVTYLGEPLCDSFLIMRYRSHRSWMTMVGNPYYLAINGLRERGVETFEASFCRITLPDRPLSEVHEAIGVHWNPRTTDEDDAPLRVATETSDTPWVYGSAEYSPISMFHRYGPKDPNPLSRKRSVLIAVSSSAHGDAWASHARLARIAELCNDPVVECYRRGSFRDYLPRSWGGTTHEGLT